MKKRDSNEEKMEDAINRLLKTYKLEKKMDEVNLINSWEELMGSMIAKHTRELYIDDQTLYVVLDSSVLRQELSYAKSKIIDLMNEKAGHEVITAVVLK